MARTHPMGTNTKTKQTSRTRTLHQSRLASATYCTRSNHTYTQQTSKNQNFTQQRRTHPPTVNYLSNDLHHTKPPIPPPPPLNHPPNKDGITPRFFCINVVYGSPSPEQKWGGRGSRGWCDGGVPPSHHTYKISSCQGLEDLGAKEVNNEDS